jgi:hypothetical protein
MHGRSLTGLIALALVCALAASPAAAQTDPGKLPDWNGQWRRIGAGNQWDPTKPAGLAQQAPLTPEYQAIFEANLADQAAGGQGTDPLYRCVPPGMPRQMTVVFPMEIMIMPSTTYMAFEQGNVLRRIYTDGRGFPAEREPSFAGYSIGKWLDQGGTGRYDLLEIETRGFKGPRVYDPAGIPLHQDNESIVKERLFLDKQNPDLMHDEITTIDHALTRPWTVTKTVRRERNPMWYENNCMEDNHHVEIGAQSYFLGADGMLMPAKKDQLPPDLRYFKPARK